jgi:hypothetical protein
MLTVQVLLAVGLSLVLFTMLTNVLIVAYGRGVVRAALDEAVRTASAAGVDEAWCVAQAQGVLDDLLGGGMRAGVGEISCLQTPDRVTATVETAFTPWLPGVPDFSFTTEAVAVRTVEP